MSRIHLCVVRGLAIALLAGPAAPGVDAAAARQTAQGQPPIDARLKAVTADLFSGSQRVDEDIAELKAILALDPKSAEAHMLLGIAYRTKGSQDLIGEAAGELREALALDPALVPAHLYLAHVYLDLARPERAREELQAGIAQAPGQPQLLALLGETERQLGNPKTTIDLTKQALEANPSYAEARYYQGLALNDLGRRDEAIKAFEAVLEAGGRRPEVYASLGSVDLAAGRVDDAIVNLTEGLKLDQSRSDMIIALARAYRLKGQLARAEEVLAHARELVPATAVSGADQQAQRDLHLEDGLIRLARGQLAAAGKALQKVVDLDSSFGPGHRYLAEVFLRQGLYAKALDQATRAEKLGSPLPADLQKTLTQKTGGGPPKGRP
jgi:tetratricopeptide (TPR) repeat protein